VPTIFDAVTPPASHSGIDAPRLPSIGGGFHVSRTASRVSVKRHDNNEGKIPMTVLTGKCLDSAERLAKLRACLESVSKNVEGELRLLDRERNECREEKCESLTTDHLLHLRLDSHKPCDSKVGRKLDGELVVRELISVLADGTGEGRGLHSGAFHWASNGIRIEGTLSGMTNVGTHRAPAFDDCQECKAPGFMEGRLSGRVTRARDEQLIGCEVAAAYRLQFDPSEGFQSTAVRGTIEGLLVCRCGKSGGGGSGCLDIGAFPAGSHPNPWSIAGYEFSIFEWDGTPASTADVLAMGVATGLNANYETRITLPGPASSVNITLIHFSSPATVKAYDAGGAFVDSATMTVAGTPQTLTLSGPGITSLVVFAPQNETLILEICPS
jgi:hypothetical protein